MTATLTRERNRIDGARPLATGEATNVVYYEGDRVYFRPLEIEDEPLLKRWVNDPCNWRTLMFRPPLNAQREREYIEGQGKSETDYTFGIVARDGHRLIGSAGLHRVRPIDRRATFGIMIGDRASQNRGYGSEAVRLTLRFGFEELNLNRIELSVFANNPRAIWCYQKAGFVQEGCLRQACYRNGQYVDEYRFAVLRSEWEETVRDPAVS
jgi:RimJ/RimL family protein N-acetyltransferase